MKQPTAKPTRKVTVGGITGAATVLLVWMVKLVCHYDIPAEIATAIATVLSFAAAYMTENHPNDR